MNTPAPEERAELSLDESITAATQIGENMDLASILATKLLGKQHLLKLLLKDPPAELRAASKAAYIAVHDESVDVQEKLNDQIEGLVNELTSIMQGTEELLYRLGARFARTQHMSKETED